MDKITVEEYQNQMIALVNKFKNDVTSLLAQGLQSGHDEKLLTMIAFVEMDKLNK